METPRSVWSQAHFALSKCLEKGVSEFVICAGARNGTLVEILEKQSHLKIYNFFEERSAAFFAMGRIRATQKPVAVVTTSGTAVAEALPAVIEASYQGLPLLILSADRPQRFRGSGSPQTIQQVGFFTSHVAGTWDLEAESQAPSSWEEWNLNQPFHFNVCFEEPPAKLQVPEEFLKLEPTKDLLKPSSKNRILPDLNKTSEVNKLSELPELSAPLIVLGPLAPEDRPLVRGFLKEIKAPVIAETLSGLSDLGQSFDLEFLFRQKILKSVLRIGSVPTLRFWRDLEAEFSSVPVVNLVSPRAPWSGLSRSCVSILGFENLRELWLRVQAVALPDASPSVVSKSAGELDLIQKLAPKLKNQILYLGNSLTVRHFDQVEGGLVLKDVYGNRGVNGIDGQISTYLGWTAQQAEESWCVVGDLTALYDLQALWVTPQLTSGKRRIMVVNNGGGMIFKKFSESARFLNRHEIGFSDWARMWGWDYVRWDHIPENITDLPSHVIIELVPHE
jgi:2-succinyl-5-enolpyruvyl-6-hydroxy-3-cyclohexene-1-carboxylate synthase